jgi:hypothetical protein
MGASASDLQEKLDFPNPSPTLRVLGKDEIRAQVDDDIAFLNDLSPKLDNTSHALDATQDPLRAPPK